MVSTRQCTFLLDDEGIVLATMKEGARFDLVDAQEALAATIEVAAGTRRPILVDMRGAQSESKEAREYFAGPEPAKCCTSVALLVDSPVSRMIANFFLGIRTQVVPTRVFSDAASARSWLRSHLTS